MNNMENAEEVMQILDRFTRLKQKDIPKEIDDYLRYVAKTGDTVFKWSSLKYLFREKLLNVIKHFHDTSPRVDEIPQYPNVDPFNYESMKSSLLERLEHFNAAPFTIQRLCELLIDPRKQYCRIDKFMRALEKNILVVSTIEPGRKRTDSENGDSLDSVVNGDLSLDVNVDIEMENESLFHMEPQNGNGSNTIGVTEAEETLAIINVPTAEIREIPVTKSPNVPHKSDDDILPNPKKPKLDLNVDGIEETAAKDYKCKLLENETEQEENKNNKNAASDMISNVEIVEKNAIEYKGKTAVIEEGKEVVKNNSDNVEKIRITNEAEHSGINSNIQKDEDKNLVDVKKVSEENKNEVTDEQNCSSVDTIVEKVDIIDRADIEKKAYNTSDNAFKQVTAASDAEQKNFTKNDISVEVKETVGHKYQESDDGAVIVCFPEELKEKHDLIDDDKNKSLQNEDIKEFAEENKSIIGLLTLKKVTFKKTDGVSNVKSNTGTAEIGSHVNASDFTPSVDTDANAAVESSSFPQNAKEDVAAIEPVVAVKDKLNTNPEKLSVLPTPILPPTLTLNDHPMEEKTDVLVTNISVAEVVASTSVEEIIMSETSSCATAMTTDTIELIKDEPAGMEIDDTSQEAMDQ